MAETPQKNEQLSLFHEGKRMNGKEAESAILKAAHPSLTLSYESFDALFQENFQKCGNAAEVLNYLRRKYPKKDFETQLIKLFFEECETGNIEYSPEMKAIIEKLSERLSSIFDVHFISSINTIYDYLYGVDGVFLFVDNNNPENRFFVTIDFTIDEAKMGSADIVLRASQLEKPEELASTIASRLKIKLHQIGQEDAIREVLNPSPEPTFQVPFQGGTLKLTRKISPEKLAEIAKKMAR